MTIGIIKFVIGVSNIKVTDVANLPLAQVAGDNTNMVFTTKLA
jgi:hypothetical protein